MLMDKGFTITSEGGLFRVLKTACGISQSFDSAKGMPNLVPVQFEAIWDTGAATSVITQRVVDACGLKPTRTASLRGPQGVLKTEAYMANIYLPNQVAFAGFTVVKGNPPKGWWDVLIGMDIIGQGDFSVINRGSCTEFSFRVRREAA
jgi:hypothetical protein